MLGQAAFWIGLIVGVFLSIFLLLIVVITVASIAFRMQKRQVDTAAIARMMERYKESTGAGESMPKL